MSAPAYWGAAQDAPSTNTMVSALAIIQDEMAHANIAYRLLEDIGESKEQLVYGRQPHEFKHPYGFDQPLDNWAELVVANGFFDRAGITLLSDVYQNTSYAPLKRALVKVDMEETFHLRHGRTWVKKLASDPEEKRRLQASLDWMFILTLEWFGLPDDLKRHHDQVGYGLKGQTNDQLRQTWMRAVVPFCEQHGFDVPAHHDDARDEYVIDCAFPMDFDPEAKRWDHARGAISWDDVMARWRARGPANREFVHALQRGVAQLASAA